MTRTAPRVAGLLASYGCATLAEVDAHLAGLRTLTRLEGKDRKRAAWADLNALLEARYAMTTKGSA